MSDLGDTTPTPDAPADAVVDTPVDATPDAPASGAAPDATPAEQDTFDRAYVESLRKESAGYRTKAKTYEEAFDGYDDESREVFLSLAKDLINAPDDAARRMIEVSRSLLGDGFDAALTGEPKPLTQADVQRMLQEKDASAQEQAAIRAVEQEARDLGYKDQTPDIANLFWYAHNETGGDLKAAHEKVAAAKQSIIDEYLASKKSDGDAFVTTSTDGVGAGNSDGPAKTLEEAKRRTIARLSAIPGQ